LTDGGAFGGKKHIPQNHENLKRPESINKPVPSGRVVCWNDRPGLKAQGC